MFIQNKRLPPDGNFGAEKLEGHPLFEVDPD